MFSPKKLIQLIVITICLFVGGVASTQAIAEDKSQGAYPWAQGTFPWGQGAFPSMGGYGGMGLHPMFNPAMWMNPMTWMNPGNYMSLMNPMVWMNPANYMQMMNPMAYMNMMYPMMGMMGPMMGMTAPMMGGYGNPMAMMNPMMGGMHGGNPMAQMPGGQMMDPKQYEQWFSQWTDMMKQFTPQTQKQQ